jgi:hypothetical protein
MIRPSQPRRESVHEGVTVEYAEDSTINTDSTTTDYDNWASDPRNTADHIEAILRGIARQLREEALAASIERRRPYLVNRETGHLEGKRLCWVCASALVHEGPNQPVFRACRWCLAHDRGRARVLGLLHTLPLFDWPFPPVRDDAAAGRLDAGTRAAVGEAWSAVSVLDRWRRESVTLSYSFMQAGGLEGIDLREWQQRLGVGESRSRACWDAYVEGYFPRLARAVRGAGAGAEAEAGSR